MQPSLNPRRSSSHAGSVTHFIVEATPLGHGVSPRSISAIWVRLLEISGSQEKQQVGSTLVCSFFPETSRAWSGTCYTDESVTAGCRVLARCLFRRQGDGRAYCEVHQGEMQSPTTHFENPGLSSLRRAVYMINFPPVFTFSCQGWLLQLFGTPGQTLHTFIPKASFFAQVFCYNGVIYLTLVNLTLTTITVITYSSPNSSLFCITV